MRGTTGNQDESIEVHAAAGAVSGDEGSGDDAVGDAAAEAPGDGGEPVVDDRALFARLYPDLRRWAAVVGDDDMEPDDLVQEALARTLARGPLADLDDAGAYVRQVVVRLASDTRRGLGRRRRAVDRLDRPGADVQAFPSDLSELHRLAPLDRAVVYLTAVEGYTHAEAAAQLDLSHAAARLRSSRPRRRLRRALEKEDQR
ncbi:MAG: sigma-70 family RNA polymerase sigma factor [Actinomycetota bacterium]|nr:sigma-70 family RNA polymerase sigma factor [Actinomycetota bacterium]